MLCGLQAWCAYCLMHEAAGREHSILLGYGVALDWEDLRYLVLKDRAAADAALAVAAYLRHESKPGSAVFCLRRGLAGTWSLAESFGARSPELLRIWSEEQKAAAARKAGHWQEVLRKQKQAASYRKELKRLEDEVANIQTELDTADTWIQVQSARDRLNDREMKQDSARKALATALKSPQPVEQPLPAQQGLALRWLFFLHMCKVAPHLWHLSRASFLSQQVLLLPAVERVDGVAQAIQARISAGLRGISYPPLHSRSRCRVCLTVWLQVVLKTCLVSYYNTRQKSIYATPTSPHVGYKGPVNLVFMGAVPSNINPSSTVDAFHSSDAGVWHPDRLEPALAWLGVGSASDARFPKCFNPWAALPAHSMVLAYTEELRDAADKCALQGFMDCSKFDEVQRSRGNLGVASQGETSSCLVLPRSQPRVEASTCQ
jgi:hypothetical protein